ncbi:unnamed protein product [Colias eurytheme]|nr:unnamed protein product [Colias eurytheme]
MKVLLKLSFIYVIFSLLFHINDAYSMIDNDRPSDCYLQADPGLCLAYNVRYYFDIKENSCKEFIYGGCGGNSNRFYTMSECMEACNVN